MKYQRILLKMSGEILAYGDEKCINHEQLTHYTQQVKQIHALGIQIAIVIGGGNIYRGEKTMLQLNRVQSDQMGILATAINGIALSEYLEASGIPSIHLSTLNCANIVATYNQKDALKALNRQEIVVISGGLGLPYCTTDTTASLRAIELNVDLLLKATRVDGIYTKDPKIDPHATKFHTLTFQEALQQKLTILDRTAFALCETHNMPILVFNILEQGALKKIILGTSIGTMVVAN